MATSTDPAPSGAAAAFEEYLASVVTDPEHVRIADHGTPLERMRMRFMDGYARGYSDALAGTARLHVFDLTMQWDEAHWFPFVEDENCNITGPGHQDKATFAQLVNLYDDVCNGEPLGPDERWTADDIGHTWIRLPDDDGDLFITEGVTAETPGAIPVTTLWGAR